MHASAVLHLERLGRLLLAALEQLAEAEARLPQRSLALGVDEDIDKVGGLRGAREGEAEALPPTLPTPERQAVRPVEADRSAAARPLRASLEGRLVSAVEDASRLDADRD